MDEGDKTGEDKGCVEGKQDTGKNSRARSFFRKALCYATAAAAFYIGMNFSRIEDYTVRTYGNAVIAAKKEAGGLARKVLDYTGQPGQHAEQQDSTITKAKTPPISSIYSLTGSEEKAAFINDMISNMPAGQQKDMLLAVLMRQMGPETTRRLGQNIALEMLAEVESNLSSACSRTSIPYCETLVRRYVLTEQNKERILDTAARKASHVISNLDQYTHQNTIQKSR